MRHESIQTTNFYYVDLDADEIAEDLYRVSGQVSAVFSTVPPAVEDFRRQWKQRNPLKIKGLREWGCRDSNPGPTD